MVRRARPRHARSHGSWKVAFAAFATAVMALFMVLRLMNSKPETRHAIAEYFFDKSTPLQEALLLRPR